MLLEIDRRYNSIENIIQPVLTTSEETEPYIIIVVPPKYQNKTSFSLNNISNIIDETRTDEIADYLKYENNLAKTNRENENLQLFYSTLFYWFIFFIFSIFVHFLNWKIQQFFTNQKYRKKIYRIENYKNQNFQNNMNNNDSLQMSQQDEYSDTNKKIHDNDCVNVSNTLTFNDSIDTFTEIELADDYALTYKNKQNNVSTSSKENLQITDIEDNHIDNDFSFEKKIPDNDINNVNNQNQVPINLLVSQIIRVFDTYKKQTLYYILLGMGALLFEYVFFQYIVLQYNVISIEELEYIIFSDMAPLFNNYLNIIKDEDER